MTVLVNQTLSPFLLGLIDSIHAHGYDISYTSSTLAHPGDITCTERALAIFVSLAVPSDNIRNNMHRYRLAVNLYTNVHVIIVQRDNSSAVDFLKIQSWFLSEIPSIQLHMIYDVEQVSIRVIQLVGNCNSPEMNKEERRLLSYETGQAVQAIMLATKSESAINAGRIMANTVESIGHVMDIAKKNIAGTRIWPAIAAIYNFVIHEQQF